MVLYPKRLAAYSATAGAEYEVKALTTHSESLGSQTRVPQKLLCVSMLVIIGEVSGDDDGDPWSKEGAAGNMGGFSIAKTIS